MSIKGKRIIKNENFTSNNIEISNVPNNTFAMHPVTMILYEKNKNPLCLTKNYLDNNNNIKFHHDYKCQNQTNASDYKKKLYVPPIGLSSVDLLSIYNIQSFDDLNNWIEDEFKEGANNNTVNRILNCWIKNNINLFKNNNFLENKIVPIYQKLLSITIPRSIKSEEIKSIMIDWFNKKSSNDFYFDLLEDIIHHIKK
jgi:hypothetical protein